jgi:hypothetical protein|tara:strand:- start:82 stop:348 length:267 start_codon:yes stop_codon:yes gene_type:complete
MASSAGVSEVGFPKHPRSPYPISSPKKRRMFGRGGEAKVGVAGITECAGGKVTFAQEAGGGPGNVPGGGEVGQPFLHPLIASRVPELV